MTNQTEQNTRWIEATIANDEVSSDEELRAYFIENGLSAEEADGALARRDYYLKGGI